MPMEEFVVEVLPFIRDYEAGLAQQHRLHGTLQREQGELLKGRCGYLLAGEHDPVYTLGKHGRSENMLVSKELLERMGVKVVGVDRGGDITYHGPGQLVAYPILHLPTLGLGAKEYVAHLLDSVRRTCATFGVTCVPREDAPGLWLGCDGRGHLRKICAVGVHIGQGITTHGFALNVNTALGYFDKINPCGLRGCGVTSLSAELGREVDFDAVREQFFLHFAKVFGVHLRMENA